MNFFTHQEDARRASRRLTVYFVMAVAVTAIAVMAVGAMALETLNPLALGAVGLLTGGVIVGGSMFRTAQLSDGGSAVAEMMDGRRLTSATTELDERRLLNVVEEMALASGVPVPLVYVMDRDETMNAFAAGYSPNDAAVAVTRGLLTGLKRDELQGVIAHEFSHILNGDMRLNIRMIGVLYGLEMIGQAGRVMLEADGRSRARSSFGGIGLGLLIAGFGGMAVANWIRAAVSREREYLADASAVQFTRNPEGIGNALVRIAIAGSVVSSAHAGEVSHMMIAAPLARSQGARGLAAKGFGSGLATHPPIEERVKRVLGPMGVARLADERRTAVARADAGGFMRTGHDMTSGFNVAPSGRPTSMRELPPISMIDAAIASIGQPQAAHVDYARAMMAELPDDLRAGLRSVDGAKGILVALIAREAVQGTDLRAPLRASGEMNALDHASWFSAAIAALPDAQRLPLAQLAFPALRALPAAERNRFVAAVRTLVAADGKMTAFELALTAMLARQLGEASGEGSAKRTAPSKSLADLSDDAALVVSLFIRAASQGSVLFDRFAAELGLKAATLAAPSKVTLAAVEAATTRLADLLPTAKARLVRACMEIVLVDTQVTVREAELMRAVCALLDAPLPPVIELRSRVGAAQDASEPARV